MLYELQTRCELFTDDGVSAVSRMRIQLSVFGGWGGEEDIKIVTMKSPGCVF